MTILADTSGTGFTLTTYRSDLVLAFCDGGGAGGAEPNKQINLLLGADTDNPPRAVLSQTSDFPVGVAEHQEQLFVAWQGTDDLGRVNVTFSGDGHFRNGEDETNKVVLADTATTGVSLASAGDHLFMAWCGGGGMGGAEPNKQINIAWSASGKQWDVNDRIILPNRSDFRPVIATARGAELSAVWIANDAGGTVLTTDMWWDDYLQKYSIYNAPYTIGWFDSDNRFRTASASIGLSAAIISRTLHIITTEGVLSDYINPDTGEHIVYYPWICRLRLLPIGVFERYSSAQTTMFSPTICDKWGEGGKIAWTATDGTGRLNLEMENRL